MASVQDFTFQSMSRIGNDTCGLNETDLQNVKHGNYMLTNHFADDCAMKKPIDFATSQPNINYTGSHQMGVGGCNVDVNSKLLVKKINASNKCKLNLQERPYTTVPYLGRGSVDPTVESEIQQGEMITNKRSITKLGEKSYLEYTNTPLQNDLKERFTNPVYSVEGAASSGWVRGGVPSRELMRDACRK